MLTETAPSLFQSAPGTILATHADGSLITQSSPASPGEVVVIYAVGLGHTVPDTYLGQVATSPAEISISRILRSFLAAPRLTRLWSSMQD